MTQKEFENTLRPLLNVLDDQEKKVIMNRYGLDMPALSIKKAEKQLGISSSSIRTIEKNAIKKIKSSKAFASVQKILAKEKLENFMPNGITGYYVFAIQILR